MININSFIPTLQYLTSQVFINNDQVTQYNFSFDPTNGNPDLLNPPPNVSIIPGSHSIKSSLQNIQNHLNPQSPLGPIYQIPTPPNNGSHPPGAFYRMHDGGLIYFEPDGSFYQASGSHRVPGSANPNTHNSRTFTLNGNNVSVQNNTQPLPWTLGMAYLGLKPNGNGSYTSTLATHKNFTFLLLPNGNIMRCNLDNNGQVTNPTFYSGANAQAITQGNTFTQCQSQVTTAVVLSRLEAIPQTDSTWIINNGNGFNELRGEEHSFIRAFLPNLRIRAGNNLCTIQDWTGKNLDKNPELRYQFQNNGQTNTLGRYAVVNGNICPMSSGSWWYSALPEHTAPRHFYIDEKGKKHEWESEPIIVKHSGKNYTLSYDDGDEFWLKGNGKNIPYNFNAFKSHEKLTWWNYYFLGIKTSSGYEKPDGSTVTVNQDNDFEGSIRICETSSSGFGASTTSITVTKRTFSKGTIKDTVVSDNSFTSVPP